MTTLRLMENARKHRFCYHVYDDGGGLLAQFDSFADAGLVVRFLNGTPMTGEETAHVVALLDQVDELR